MKTLGASAEVIGIFSNMARKYDRLLVAFDERRPAAAEPLGDTVANLCVDVGKYLTWIAEERPADLDAARIPPTARSISARLGPDALRALLEAVLRDPGDLPGGSQRAWTRVQEGFEALERGLMAQAAPDSEPADVLSYAEKTRVTWGLVRNTAWLLLYLEREDPATLARLRDEIAHMDGVARDG
jgi:hypothetical protein